MISDSMFAVVLTAIDIPSKRFHCAVFFAILFPSVIRFCLRSYPCFGKPFIARFCFRGGLA